ncbi:MAG: radical SAM protein [Helicobacter sp.]|nr:radical SAM protein [Helicobacter sp.]
MEKLESKKVNPIIFGPVNSRRFGRSLGIDLSPSKKQCNFDCVYCELEGKKPQAHMDEIVPLEDILSELEQNYDKNIDVLTITANGEPTLYPYLYELIVEIKKRYCAKTLILSNGSKFGDPKTRAALLLFDIVKFSFDGGDEKSFARVDRPHKSLDFGVIKRDILEFSKIYQGQLIAEILFVKNLNDKLKDLQSIIAFFKTINVSRIDLSTIDRPPAHNCAPLAQSELEFIASFLRDNLDCNISVPKRAKVTTIKQESFILDAKKILETIKRRPLEVNELKNMLDLKGELKLIELIENGKIWMQESGGNEFYTVKKPAKIG